MYELNWQGPKVAPIIELYSEKEFWLAIETRIGGKITISTFLAMYQNRPFNKEIDEIDDGCHVNEDGEFISSVGWFHRYSHVDFDNFYESITFNDNCKLLGWAEYTPPKFNINKLVTFNQARKLMGQREYGCIGSSEVKGGM